MVRWRRSGGERGRRGEMGKVGTERKRRGKIEERLGEEKDGVVCVCVCVCV